MNRPAPAPESAEGGLSLGAVTARRPRAELLPLVRSMRPKQFVKNGMVLVAFVFSVNLAWHPLSPATWFPLLVKLTLAFIAFCAVSAAEYLINDVRDVETDRVHPRKRLRPIAAGQVSVGAAQATAALLFTLGIVVGAALGWKFLVALVAYGLLMLMYSFVLKHLVIIDLLTIAIGFDLRAIAGALAINVQVSPWLYLCTILGALFLAVNKRRHELLLLGDSAVEHRRILAEYSTQLIEQISATVTACTIIAYSLYTFTADNLPVNHAMMATIPFVMYGIFRYLYLVYQKEEGGSPDELVVRDRPLLICMGLYLLTSGAILAVFRR